MNLIPPPKCAALEVKRKAWIECMGSEDRNSILRQVAEMIWFAGAYRVVVEARRLADKDANGQIKLHGLTHGLLDHCFYQSQLVSIRKLLDNFPWTGDKGVFSLKSLVVDIRKNCSLLTRQNLFAAFDTIMDVEALTQREYEFLIQRQHQGHTLSEIDPGMSSFQSERLHTSIDALAGVTKPDRSPNDVVQESLLSSLESRLDSLERLCVHVNKFIAHAATPASRALVDADNVTLRLAELWNAHETICRTCEFLDCHLLRRTSHSFLAIPTGNLMAYVSNPLVSEENVEKLRAVWKTYAHETNTWTGDSLAWVRQPPL